MYSGIRIFLLALVFGFITLPTISYASTYTLYFGHGNTGVVDGETRYFTHPSVAPQLAANKILGYIPVDGTIVDITGATIIPSQVASNENVYLGITIYNPDKTLKSNIEVCAGLKFSTSTNNWSDNPDCIMDPTSVAVSKGDYFEAFYIYPTFATNPNQALAEGNLIIETDMCGTSPNSPCYTAQISTSTFAGVHEPINYGDWITMEMTMLFLMAFIPIGLIATFFKTRKVSSKYT